MEWAAAEKCDQKLLAAVRYHAKEPRPLFLWGTPGGGKTAVAAVVAKEAAETEAARRQVDPWVIGRGFWLAAAKAIALVQSARHDGGVMLPGAMYEVTERDLWRRWERDQLLVVDDIGVGGMTETQYAILWQLADIRQRKPTIYTSNLSQEQLAAQYDQRVVSRVCCGTVIEVQASDRRLTQQKKYTFKATT